MMAEMKLKKILKNGAIDAGSTKDKKRRVAAYCRVSSASEAQHSSIVLQEAAYRIRISENQEWELAGVYVEDGRSATRAGTRPVFQQMIQDCEAGKIDLILTKSISRFARNTLDCLEYIRKLQALGIEIVFEKENIHTGEAYSEMLLAVLAAFAQEESRSHSENIKWGVRKRFEQGKDRWVPVYGYQKEEDRPYVIVPDQARVIRRIFDEYEHGSTMDQIADRLNAEGVKTPKKSRGKDRGWENTVVKFILTNEKYAGDVLIQKRYTEDHINHRQMINDGSEIPAYYVRDHHEPIVGRKTFERVQKIIALRNNIGVGRQYPLGGRLHCPYCGSTLIRRHVLIQNCDIMWCCELGEEDACRQFVIRANLIEPVILDAYNTVDMDALERISHFKRRNQPEAAGMFLRIKGEHLTFDRLDYWWIDDLIDHISFGKHSYTASQLAGMDEASKQSLDDRTLTVHWRCGLKTTKPSGIKRDSQHPRHEAELWEAYIDRYPERFPDGRPGEHTHLADSRPGKCPLLKI